MALSRPCYAHTLTATSLPSPTAGAPLSTSLQPRCYSGDVWERWVAAGERSKSVRSSRVAVGVGAQRLQPLQRRDRESSLPHLRGDCHATSPAPPPTCLPSRLRAAGAEQANGLTHTHDGQRRAAVGERSSRRPMRACPCPLARRPLSVCLSVCLSLSLSLSLSVCLSLSASPSLPLALPCPRGWPRGSMASPPRRSLSCPSFAVHPLAPSEAVAAASEVCFGK